MNPADSLAPERVEPLLSGRFGQPYIFEESAESTQRLLSADMPEGAVAVADEQTRGRGRQGRSWQAPPGTSLLVSVVLKPSRERNVPELSLVGGLATAEAVERATGLAAQIKWPNDVMLNRRKVAGVLAEATSDAVVLGIGLNVNQGRDDLPANARVEPASLYTIDGVRRDRAGVLVDLLAALERSYDLWLEGGLDALYDGLGARDFLRGRKVFLDGRSGTGVGIDRAGRFQLDLDGERKTIESGELLFER